MTHRREDEYDHQDDQQPRKEQYRAEDSQPAPSDNACELESHEKDSQEDEEKFHAYAAFPVATILMKSLAVGMISSMKPSMRLAIMKTTDITRLKGMKMKMKVRNDTSEVMMPSGSLLIKLKIMSVCSFDRGVKCRDKAEEAKV
jgi:hypothetical protein